jgi:hypothetical protein
MAALSRRRRGRADAPAQAVGGNSPQATAAGPRSPKLLRRVARSAVVVAAVLVAYYLNPAPGSPGPVVSITWAVVTIGGCTLVALRQVHGRVAEYHASGDRGLVGLETLANVVVFVAIFFAGTYLFLSHQHNQVAGIKTHTDALYFSMTVLSTVGFGDIHATGQAARLIVTTQMLFDLVFVTSLVGFIVSSISVRTQMAMEARRSDQDS